MKRGVISCVLLGLLGVACGSSAPYTQSHIIPNFDMQKYKKVAVPPIVNLSQNTFADLHVPTLLTQQLTKRRFQVLQPADVKTILQNNDLQDSISESTSYGDLGRWLSVDGIFCITVGVYGYEKVKHAGFTVPYTTYDRARTYGFLGDEYMDIKTNVPKTNYLTVPDRVYNYAVAEIMISLYDGKTGELVFTILDVYSSRQYGLQTVARKLIYKELNKILGWNKKIKP